MPVVPLSDLQSRLLRILAAHRTPESYVAGASPLARAGTRFSADVDVFHDREEAVQQTALADANALLRAGLHVEWLHRRPALFAAVIRDAQDATRLEWLVDSDFRFFPTLPDALFGYVLHVADIATNKALAAAGRREPRDVLDLLWIDANILPLGATVWAAAAKDAGLTPEGMIAEIRRSARYRQADFDRLHMTAPVDAGEVAQRLRSALDAADAHVRAMPSDAAGKLFLLEGRPVRPDPANLAAYLAHEGTRRGHWPSSPEITAAMLDRYGRA